MARRETYTWKLRTSLQEALLSATAHSMRVMGQFPLAFSFGQLTPDNLDVAAAGLEDLVEGTGDEAQRVVEAGFSLRYLCDSSQSRRERAELHSKWRGFFRDIYGPRGDQASMYVDGALYKSTPSDFVPFRISEESRVGQVLVQRIGPIERSYEQEFRWPFERANKALSQEFLSASGFHKPEGFSPGTILRSDSLLLIPGAYLKTSRNSYK